MENLGKPEPMSFDGDLADNWKKFRTSFERYIIASGCEKAEEKVKRNGFLYCVGDKCNDICSMLMITEQDDLKTIITKLNNYFIPKTNKNKERCKFNRRMQKPGESIDSYVRELRNIALKCEYKNNLTEMILDRIISGVECEKMRTRLLEESELTYDKAVEICKKVEAEEPIKIPKKADSPAGSSGQSLQEKTPPPGKKIKLEANTSPKSVRKCTLCKVEGHTRATCPCKDAVEKAKKKNKT